MVVLVAIGWCVAIFGASAPTEAATDTVVVSATVPTYSKLTSCTSNAALQFGTLLPGSQRVTAAPYTVGFETNASSASLLLYQADNLGSAMYRMTDGRLDQSWDGSVSGNGQFTVTGNTIDNYDYSRPRTALQATTGKMVMAYYRSNSDINVIRFNDDGTLDPMFGTAGRFTVSYHYSDLNAMAIADGWSPWNIMLIKLTPDGQLDTDFDGPSGTGRFNPDGVPDTSFDGDGWAHHALGV